MSGNIYAVYYSPAPGKLDKRDASRRFFETMKEARTFARQMKNLGNKGARHERTNRPTALATLTK